LPTDAATDTADGWAIRADAGLFFGAVANWGLSTKASQFENERVLVARKRNGNLISALRARGQGD